MSNPWDSFDPRLLGHVLSLQNKLYKHVDRQDGQRCIAYLNIVFKHWTRDDFTPDDEGGIYCPIDKKIVNQALRLARQCIKNK
jgi:hypothetical protein